MSSKDRDRILGEACSFLFVPGDQPERIAKALQLKTDAVIIDLEDSVSGENKELARKSIVKSISEPRSKIGPLVVIRINAFSSPEFVLDLKVALLLNVDAIMVPKFVPGIEAESVDSAITALELELGRSDLLPVIPLIESTVGVLRLFSVSSFPKRVIRLAFGAADLYADLGVTYCESGPNSSFAMASIVMASVSCGLASPIDSPHFEIEDDLGLHTSSFFARDMGFGAKLCIHPKQLGIVATAFKRDLGEREWATQVMEKWDQRIAGKGAIRVDGFLIDEAMIKRARHILSAM